MKILKYRTDTFDFYEKIEEIHFINDFKINNNFYVGYIIKTSIQTLKFFISSNMICCEDYGVNFNDEHFYVNTDDINEDFDYINKKISKIYWARTVNLILYISSHFFIFKE